MGIRKKVRTKWKADRKKNLAAQRKKKAKRLAKQSSESNEKTSQK